MSCHVSLSGTSSVPPLAMGATAEHMGSHKVRLRSFWAPMGYARRTRVGAQKLRMHTVRPTTCSSVALMARGGAGDSPGNGPGQGFTSTIPCTYAQGASGALSGAVGVCCRRSNECANSGVCVSSSARTAYSHVSPPNSRTQWVVRSAACRGEAVGMIVWRAGADTRSTDGRRKRFFRFWDCFVHT